MCRILEGLDELLCAIGDQLDWQKPGEVGGMCHLLPGITNLMPGHRCFELAPGSATLELCVFGFGAPAQSRRSPFG